MEIQKLAVREQIVKTVVKSGNGGAVAVTGGAGTNGNATGGASSVTGGAGQGSELRITGGGHVSG